MSFGGGFGGFGQNNNSTGFGGFGSNTNTTGRSNFSSTLLYIPLGASLLDWGTLELARSIAYTNLLLVQALVHQTRVSVLPTIQLRVDSLEVLLLASVVILEVRQ